MDLRAVRTHAVRPLCLVLVLVASSSFAEGTKADCEVTPGPNDVVKKRGDIVIEAGRHVEDVIALKGSVTVKKGAEAKTVIALQGDVVVEAGATVTDAAVAVKGSVRAEPGSKTHRSIELNAKGIHIVGEDGETLTFDAGAKGNTIGKAIVSAAVAKVKTCKVVEQE